MRATSALFDRESTTDWRSRQLPVPTQPQTLPRLVRPATHVAWPGNVYSLSLRRQPRRAGTKAAKSQSRRPRVAWCFVRRRLITTAKELIKETEALLERWKHPDPFIPCTAPGGRVILGVSQSGSRTLTHVYRLKVRTQHPRAYIRSYVRNRLPLLEAPTKRSQRPPK